MQGGDRFGAYVIERRLGAGGMGVVWLARHETLGSRHAIKRLREDSPALDERLLQEGRIMATLAHPNVVRVTDTVEISGRAALVLEYIDGGTLGELIGHRSLTVEEIDALARGILLGVSAAHARGWVHRDLKPQNVLLQPVDGALVPKIADFGVAKVLDEAHPAGSTTRRGLGTRGYMPLEQLMGFPPDPSFDVFALGALLYELCEGRPAFPTVEGWEEALRTDVYPAPTRALPARMRNAIISSMCPRAQRLRDAASLYRRWTGADTQRAALAGRIALSLSLLAAPVAPPLGPALSDLSRWEWVDIDQPAAPSQLVMPARDHTYFCAQSGIVAVAGELPFSELGGVVHTGIPCLGTDAPRWHGDYLYVHSEGSADPIRLKLLRYDLRVGLEDPLVLSSEGVAGVQIFHFGDRLAVAGWSEGRGQWLAWSPLDHPDPNIDRWPSFDLVDVMGVEGTPHHLGDYLYFPPHITPPIWGQNLALSKLVRYDTRLPVEESRAWESFDLREVHPEAGGFGSAATDGRYIYFSPYFGTRRWYQHGLMVRYDSERPLDDRDVYEVFDLSTVDPLATGYLGVVFDGRFVYYAPNRGQWGSTLARYDPSRPFDLASSWTVFDLTEVHPDAVGFSEVHFDGRHVIVLGYGYGRDNPANPVTLVLRYDAAP